MESKLCKKCNQAVLEQTYGELWPWVHCHHKDDGDAISYLKQIRVIIRDESDIVFALDKIEQIVDEALGGL